MKAIECSQHFPHYNLRELSLAMKTRVPIRSGPKPHVAFPDTGYPHDGRADKDSYPHDRRADKDSYPHDGRADKDSYPHDRHKQCIMLSL